MPSFVVVDSPPARFLLRFRLDVPLLNEIFIIILPGRLGHSIARGSNSNHVPTHNFPFLSTSLSRLV
jgi:hypothetical protein